MTISTNEFKTIANTLKEHNEKIARFTGFQATSIDGEHQLNMVFSANDEHKEAKIMVLSGWNDHVETAKQLNALLIKP
jgi:hypothetical protein